MRGYRGTQEKQDIGKIGGREIRDTTSGKKRTLDKFGGIEDYKKNGTCEKIGANHKIDILWLNPGKNRPHIRSHGPKGPIGPNAYICSHMPNLTPTWPQRGPKLSQTGLQLGSNLAQLGSNLAPTWLQHDAKVAQGGPTFDHLGPTWPKIAECRKPRE